MSKIKNWEGLSTEEINEELGKGAKFVMFQYCFSIIFMSFQRSSDIYFIRAGESTAKHSIGYTILTLCVGWWGIPWGIIYSFTSLYTNFTGGKDVTAEVLAALNSEE
jgi:hypothetical protein